MFFKIVNFFTFNRLGSIQNIAMLAHDTRNNLYIVEPSYITRNSYFGKEMNLLI